jgi:hypothetical protein
MENLKTFLKVWEETGSIEAVLEKGIALPSPNVVEAHLATLTEKEKDRLLSALSNASAALSKHIGELEKQKEETQVEIGKSLKTEQACLSYNKAGKPKK